MPETTTPPPHTSGVAGHIPMTPLQLSYLAGRDAAFELGGTGTHTYAEFEIEASLEEVQWTMDRLVARYEALRLVFDRTRGTQHVLSDPGPVPVHTLDLRDLSREETREELTRLRREQGAAARDPESWPLFGVTLVSLDPRTTQRRGQLLCLDLDGLSLDLFSVLSLRAELLELLRGEPVPDQRHEAPGAHRGQSHGEHSEHELLRLIQHVQQESAERAPSATGYWNEQIPLLPPPPRLPLISSPEAGIVTKFTTRRAHLSARQLTRISRLAKSAGFSEAAFWLAALSETMAEHCGQRRFSILVPCSVRHLLPEGHRKALGPFSSFVPVGVDWTSKPLQERLRKLRTAMLMAVAHHPGAGVELVTELAARHGRAGRSVLPVVLTVGTGLYEEGPDHDEPVFTASQTAQVYLDFRIFDAADGGVRLEVDSVDEVTGEELAQSLLAGFLSSAQRLADELKGDAPGGVELPGETAHLSWEPCVTPRGALEKVLASAVAECTGCFPVGRHDPLLDLTVGLKGLDNLVLSINDRLPGLSLTRMDLLAHSHIADLAGALAEDIPNIDDIAQASVEADQMIASYANAGEDP